MVKKSRSSRRSNLIQKTKRRRNSRSNRRRNTRSNRRRNSRSNRRRTYRRSNRRRTYSRRRYRRRNLKGGMLTPVRPEPEGMEPEPDPEGGLQTDQDLLDSIDADLAAATDREEVAKLKLRRLEVISPERREIIDHARKCHILKKEKDYKESYVLQLEDEMRIHDFMEATDACGKRLDGGHKELLKVFNDVDGVESKMHDLWKHNDPRLKFGPDTDAIAIEQLLPGPKAGDPRASETLSDYRELNVVLDQVTEVIKGRKALANYKTALEKAAATLQASPLRKSQFCAELVKAVEAEMGVQLEAVKGALLEAAREELRAHVARMDANAVELARLKREKAAREGGAPSAAETKAVRDIGDLDQSVSGRYWSHSAKLERLPVNVQAQQQAAAPADPVPPRVRGTPVSHAVYEAVGNLTIHLESCKEYLNIEDQKQRRLSNDLRTMALANAGSHVWDMLKNSLLQGSTSDLRKAMDGWYFQEDDDGEEITRPEANENAMKAILAGADLEEPLGEGGSTALMCACIDQNKFMVNFILKNGPESLYQKDVRNGLAEEDSKWEDLSEETKAKYKMQLVNLTRESKHATSMSCTPLTQSLPVEEDEEDDVRLDIINALLNANANTEIPEMAIFDFESNKPRVSSLASPDPNTSSVGSDVVQRPSLGFLYIEAWNRPPPFTTSTCRYMTPVMTAVSENKEQVLDALLKGGDDGSNAADPSDAAFEMAILKGRSNLMPMLWKSRKTPLPDNLLELMEKEGPEWGSPAGWAPLKGGKSDSEKDNMIQLHRMR